MKQFLLVLLTLVGLTTGKLAAQTVTSTPSSPVSVLPGGTFTITKGSSGWPINGTYAITVSPSASGITLQSFSTSSGTGTVSISSSVAPGSYTVKLKRGSTSSTNGITVNVYSVNAGSDQTITLPTSSVTFSDASVSTGTAPAATFHWTQTSGPATATIATPTSLNTGATGLTVVGTYVFRLTINGNSTLYNEVSITVATPPSASMSASPITIIPGSVNLTTSGINFSGTGNYTYSWSAYPSNGVTLPGTTSSGNNSITNSFSFTTTGTYIIAATVTKGTGTATVNDTVYVVTSGTKSYGTPVYSANIRGGHVMIGNTVLAASSYSDNNNSSSNTSTIMNYFSVASDGTTSIYGNDNSDMEYVNIDNGATSGVYNSSAANLALPSGTNTIKFARLYWGGHLTSSDFTSSNLTTVKIKNGTGNYGSVTIPATQVNVIAQTNGNGDTYYIYQAYADISNFIQTHGSGTYTLANVPASTGIYSKSEGGAYGGWGIVVAYENASLPSYYSIRIYDAFLLIAQNSTAQTVTLNNLNAPNNTLLATEAYLSTFAWEGDANLAASNKNAAGDYLQINGHTYSDAVNPATNMWNGTISNNGTLVTTSNPSYKNQMGIDIDQINVGTNYGITANTTSVSVTFGTESDQYYPSVFAFSIKMKDPLVTINKTVTGSRSPVNSLFANETLTYVIAGQNTGSGDLSGATVTDTLPSDITYVPGSMKIYSYPSGNAISVTDNAGDDPAFITTTSSGIQILTFYVGTGATKNGGGILAGATSDQYKVQFQATTPAIVNALTTVSNTAYVSGIGSQSGNLSTTITNQSTAIISPINSLPIVLTSFNVTKSGSDALLKWTTVTEKDNNHMDVQRSSDGVTFQKVGSVEGNGTTQLTHDYQYTDPIGGLSGILYYRLQIVDNDGKATYSTIVALRLDGSSFSTDFSVYPNPFVSNIKLNVSSTKEINASVSIMNLTGQRLSGTSAKLQSGSNVLVLDNLNKLQPGIYVIELVTEDGDKFYQKVVKQ